VDFDRDRLSTGELIAGISGLVLLISLWFKWYGVEVEGAGGVLQNVNFGVSANAWQSFGLIDIILFLVALLAIGVAVMRALNKMPDMPYPPATLLAIAGGIALLLILFRTLSTPVDTGGVDGIDVSRKIGLWIGLLSAAALTYGGWRAMQESGASLGSGGPRGGGAGDAPTQQAPAAGGPPAGGAPGVPGGGAAGVSPGKEGPGAPHPGTSTGGPGEGGGGPTPPAASDPAPGSPTPGLSGDPDTPGGTTPPGLGGDPNRPTGA
jgi:hypothetical protein